MMTVTVCVCVCARVSNYVLYCTYIKYIIFFPSS